MQTAWSMAPGALLIITATRMNRRSFFQGIFTDTRSHSPAFADAAGFSADPRIPASAGLEPLIEPLSLQQAYHLLRRITFAPTVEAARQLQGKTAPEALELLLGTGSGELPAGPSWVDSATENPLSADMYTRFQIEGGRKSFFGQLQNWWLGLMVQENLPVAEKLTLFWSGHFTTEFDSDVYVLPQLLYRQNQLLRRSRLGNFRTLAENITLDGAMLTYLGGELNFAGKPNENYARELMELYTTGLGQYTEGDVQEAARVLTGWRIAKFSDEKAPNGIYNIYFEPTAHDINAKQFMGRSIPARDADTNTEFLVRRDEVQRLISILFEERGPAIASFICEKIYRHFVYSRPGSSDQEIISGLSSLFRQHDFEIRPVLFALLSSQHFFAENNQGVQIKTPAEFVVGLARQLGATLSQANSVMNAIEQSLMDPPDVSGWAGWRTWISTKTYPLRLQFARNLLSSVSDQQLVSLMKKFPEYQDVDRAASALEEYFLPKKVSSARHENYVKILLQNAPEYEWPSIMQDTPTAARNIRALLAVIIKAPDFQLC